MEKKKHGETRRKVVLKKYRLFLMKYSLENVKFASSFRFSRVTPNYILVYAQRARLKPPDGKSGEIKAEELGVTSKQDQGWLMDCVSSLMAEAIKRSEKDDLQRISEMVVRLERELELEARAGEEIESD